MKSIVRFSIKQTVFINVIFVILVVTGIFSLLTNPVENMPTVDMGKIFIHTVYFGASANDVENLVTIKIEDALDGLKNVEYIQSRSYRNFSSIEVKFIDDTDYRALYDELRFRILSIKDELPQGADEPSYLYADTHIWIPAIIVNITGKIPASGLKKLAEELKTDLLNLSQTIPDTDGLWEKIKAKFKQAYIRDVELIGEYDQEFHVSIDPDKLRQYGITFNQAAHAVVSANTRIPTGRFRKAETEFMLDTGTRLGSQNEVLNIIVRRDGDGNFIRIRDLVTTARLSHRDPSSIPSVNGENTIRLRVIKEENGDSLDISQGVKELARAFEKAHQNEGIRIIFTNDSTIEINDSVKTLSGNLILGMILVLIILWVTLGFRNALITAVGIPFAFICTIIIMKFSGVSINTISLFAFVLVTGIMVDDAVIIMENIFRHLQMGKPKKNAVIDGVAEVMMPVIASAITTVLAFLPMLIMSGSTGEFFGVIPTTVTFALIASLLEALFILPIHILDWGPEVIVKEDSLSLKEEDPFIHLQTGIFAFFWKIYHGLVQVLLNHKLITFVLVSFLFLGTVLILILSITGIYPLINVKFFPGNYFRYHVTITNPVAASLEQTDKVVRDLSKFIMSLGKEQAQSASGAAGYYEDEDYVHHSGHQYGQIVVTLPDEKVRNFPENPANDPMVHLEYISNKIREFIDLNYNQIDLKPKVKIFEEPDGPPAGKAVNIRVTSPVMTTALQAAQKLMDFMQKNPELQDLTDLDSDEPSRHRIIKYIPRQTAVFEYGLLPGEVTALTAAALNGYNAGKFRTVDQEIDLIVRIARKDDPANSGGVGLNHPMDVLNIPIIEDSVSPVHLRDLVKVEYFYEPSVRLRYKNHPTITITANIREGVKLSPARVQVIVSDFIKSSLQKQPNRVFTGVSFSYGGQFESTNRSYTSLSIAFCIAIMAIYMVLSSQFNSYVQPLIIITAVPFALIGVVLGLLVTRTTFTIGSFMAIVGLAGVAVNDSLLLIDFMNTRLAQGRALRDAVIESCAARMRPVLITTVTTILGLLPMAIGIPRKSISWSPMAIAFVAGLCSATMLALLIIPVEYEFFGKIQNFFKKESDET